MSGAGGKLVIHFNINQFGITFQIKTKNINIELKLQQFFSAKDAIGIRSKTTSGHNIIFLDYDNILYKEMLVPEIKYLQDKYKLSDFYILKSSQKSDNYHAICLDKLRPKEWMKILEDTSCDDNYKKTSLRDYKAWTLRISPKGDSKAPMYYATVHSPYNKREKSLAHKQFLSYHYNIPIQEDGKYDQSGTLLTTEYKTINTIKREAIQ